MPFHSLPAHEALHRSESFDAIIDARTPREFAEDHLPQAQNWPSLSDDERVTIGTLYKRVGAFEAKKLGAVLTARNIANHIERWGLDLPKSWRPLVYCWRGGNRSGALATVLSAIGFHVTLIEGGYKAWRNAMLAALPASVEKLNFRVICGPTGSGKTRLLHALAAAGAQVLDLEALASHRSSVLGVLPQHPQPSQKRFETLLWSVLQGFDPTEPVFVESESKKVGNLRVPDALMQSIRQGACIDLQLPFEHRVSLLMQDYALFLQDPGFFCERLTALIPKRGKAVIDQWIEWVKQGRSEAVVHALLQQHYDPVYAASTTGHFQRFAQAQRLVLPDGSPETLSTAARQLLSGLNH